VNNVVTTIRVATEVKNKIDELQAKLLLNQKLKVSKMQLVAAFVKFVEAHEKEFFSFIKD
jgi:predicted nucleic acid-binding OB-fold protein